MKSWKHWPYWLRGGVIGGGVTLLFVVLFYSCGLFDTDSESFFCLPFIIVSPSFPFAILFDKLNPIFQYQLPFIIMPVVSVLSWFIFGSFVGLLVGHIKRKKNLVQ
ncbi:MAG: hypothetical protein Q7S86_03695 [bacterium]|nr:hypothetical protein [bacterium]